MFKKFALLVLLTLSLVSTVKAQSAPVGWLDQVVFEGGEWKITGWACQPGYGAVLSVQVYLNNFIYGGPVLTNEFAEPEIHQVCGTSSSSGLRYRFSIPYPTNLPLNGQYVKIIAQGDVQAELTQSNQIRMPLSSNHADAVLAAANKILIVIAHVDDEINFAPMLAKHCPTKVCKLFIGLSPNEFGPTRLAELAQSAAAFPLQVEHGNLSGNLSVAGDPGYKNIGVQETLNRWDSEITAVGFANLGVAVRNLISEFQPDVILTFDPRHGTTCHSEHRAAGQAVLIGVQGYNGTQFNVHNVFFLTSVRTGLPPSYIGFTTPVFLDPSSVEYSADDYNPYKGKSGWDFAIDIVRLYPSAFDSSVIAAAINSGNRAISFQGIDDYNPIDSRYMFSDIPGNETCHP